MIQSRSSFGLAAEAFERWRILGERFGEKFDGDKALEARVLRLVDNAHATTTEVIQDAVVGKGLADERIAAWHLLLILGWEGRQVNECGERLEAQLAFSAFHTAGLNCESPPVSMLKLRGDRPGRGKTDTQDSKSSEPSAPAAIPSNCVQFRRIGIPKKLFGQAPISAVSRLSMLGLHSRVFGEAISCLLSTANRK